MALEQIYRFETAVLFIIFNRPETTFKVFNVIKEAKPKLLFISGDGPRNSNESEVVYKLRRDILSLIDWDCEVKTLFQINNLGCGKSVSSSITWFFQNVNEGIILEDDCLPSLSFFRYCQELLEKYRDNRKVFMISGDGRSTKNNLILGDYCFVKYPMIWGWATWSRSWDGYDIHISNWQGRKNKLLNNLTENKGTQRYFREVFELCHINEIDTWDYQFAYLIFSNEGLCIVPKVNLISNIGFGPNATHTRNVKSKDFNVKNYEIEFPLNHQIFEKDSKSMNAYFDSYYFNKPVFLISYLSKVIEIFKSF